MINLVRQYLNMREQAIPQSHAITLVKVMVRWSQLGNYEIHDDNHPS
jgi:hypothetical protein